MGEDKCERCRESECGCLQVEWVAEGPYGALLAQLPMCEVCADPLLAGFCATCGAMRSAAEEPEAE